jgi:hypothetical protein
MLNQIVLLAWPIIFYFLSIFTQALTEINDHKGKLQSIQELSAHLLYLEPIFDGRPVSDDLRTLSNHFQNLVMEVFSLLEAQVKIVRHFELDYLKKENSKVQRIVFMWGVGGPLKAGPPPFPLL